MNRRNPLTRTTLADFLVLSFSVLFVLAASLVSLHRFWQYEVFFYDFGIFDQAIWKVSRWQSPVTEHLAVGGKTIFADHFNPSIFLLSPLFWVTPRSEVLLVAQAVAVGLSALVLYAIGKHLLHNTWLSCAVTLSCVLFVGLQNALISDIHEVTFATLPLLLTFLAIVKKWRFRYVLFLLITLGMKESIFLVGVGIGMFILATQKKLGRIGVVTILISLFWGVVVTKVIIPFFSDGIYGYTPTFAPSAIDIVSSLINDPTKQQTLLVSFGSFLFLPLLSPSLWFLIGQDFATRFLPQFSETRWGLGLHYSALLAPILAVASIFGIARILESNRLRRFAPLLGALLVVNSVFLHYRLRAPLGLAYNPAFYEHTNHFAFLDTLVAHVPQEGTVMTQNNLAVRFSHRNVFLLRDGYAGFQPDFIVLDARRGQNPNNFFGLQKKSVGQILEELQADPAYEPIYQTDQQFIFRRKPDVP